MKLWKQMGAQCVTEDETRSAIDGDKRKEKGREDARKKTPSMD